MLTFSCYGTRLHGRADGSVDRAHNAWKGRCLNPNAALHDYEERLLRVCPVLLDENERGTVLTAIREVCLHDGWALHAAHVRSNHVHVVVSADCDPNVVMARLKAYASRALNARFGPLPKRWTRHGSTLWLWDHREVDKAVGYVLQEQGRPMARYENPGRWQDYLGC
jgi:REP element-mobilizing transposase RayT